MTIDHARRVLPGDTPEIIPDNVYKDYIQLLLSYGGFLHIFYDERIDKRPDVLAALPELFKNAYPEMTQWYHFKEHFFFLPQLIERFPDLKEACYSCGIFTTMTERFYEEDSIRVWSMANYHFGDNDTTIIDGANINSFQDCDFIEFLKFNIASNTKTLRFVELSILLFADALASKATPEKLRPEIETLHTKMQQMLDCQRIGRPLKFS